LALFLYAVTLFCSAFLLFLVQPIIGQKILPKLGGTPSVWNTCVVFFQLTLLVGYAYTHFATKLPVRRQILIHCLLLFVPFLILLPNGPFPVASFMPVTGGNPMLQTLILLATIVGIPFFVVSTTAPLLQKWFGHTGHPAAKDPYFLYGASNLGSMLALLLYPVLFEPIFGLEQQSWFYTIGYVVLVGIVICCAIMAFQGVPSVQVPGKKQEEEPEKVPSFAPEPPAEPMQVGAQVTTAVTSSPPPLAPALGPKQTAATGIKKGGKKFKGRDLAKMASASSAIAPGAPPAGPVTTPNISRPGGGDPDEITWPRRLRWIGLAAVPSSLMLGVTVYMSTDISAIPLFWVLPLALYLFSFILVFMRWPINWLDQAHIYVLYAQPILLALLALFMAISPGVVYISLVMLLAFTLTALACHGEMAKDRPTAKHLTEFYLLMSVGGAVGGLFNGIIAPIIFPWGVVEFGLALTVAGLLRPTLRDTGWTETLLGNLGEPQDGGKQHGKGGKKIARPRPEAAGLTRVLDFALPIGVFVLLAALLWGFIQPRGENSAELMFYAVIVPVVCTACFFARPIRFGLALGAILLLTGVYLNSSGDIVYQTRSYFGVLRVREYTGGTHRSFGIPYMNLMHGTTDHGMALEKTPKEDASRVATTYYHRQGPVGICMDRFNWFPKDYLGGPDPNWAELFKGDNRMPTSLAGLGAPGLGVNFPVAQLVGAWAEPPYAVIGMGTATMSSYARPFQTCHFYEIDENIRWMSLPEKGGTTYFGYVQAALKRGANIQILMGDARLRMAMPWVPDDMKTKSASEIPFDSRGGPENFYHLMVVDAFSSDAIPRHLITKEAMEMYFKHLVQGRWVDVDPDAPLDPQFYSPDKKKMWVPGGVLCVHTSNRHLRLVPVVTDTASKATWDDLNDLDSQGVPKKKVGLVANKGHDMAPGLQYLEKKEDIGHYTSEWVIVARDEKDLKHLRAPSKYNEWMKLAHEKDRKVPEYETYWTWQSPTGNFVWTDDHTNLMAVFRWPWAHRGGD
jgi:hypothetical protein